MLIWTTRFSRKKAVLSVLAFGLVMVLLILLTARLKSGPEPLPRLADNAQRVEYLRSLGWEVEEEPLETLQFLLPDPLTEPYLTYNELQLEQGFDLNGCAGEKLTRYTYQVTSYPDRPDDVQANLYLWGDTPVAGDLCGIGADGFQLPLIQAAPQD